MRSQNKSQARPFPAYQATIAEPVSISGIGVHSGKQACVTLYPAEAYTGVVFCRKGAEYDTAIPARYDQVSSTTHCTVVGTTQDNCFATIEHLMAALAGLAIDNVIVEVDGEEIPVLDGSAKVFIDALSQVDKQVLPAKRRYLKIKRPVEYRDQEGFVQLRPYKGQRLEVDIDFSSPAIGRQNAAIDIGTGNFRQHIARARTFGFLSDVEQLWQAGFALGASLDNAIVIKDDKVINPEGLRYKNEFARHKLLDAIGDLALAGAPILGAFYSYRGGHRLNNAILRTLFADQSAWDYVQLPAEPARAGSSAPLAAATLAPEVL